MNRSRQRGVALVITLVLLAVVTTMAVLFLGISRRERASIRVTEDQTDARLAADSGLARAQAEIAGRIMAATNLFKYDLFVSTNWIHPDGYSAARGTNALNVAYTYANGQPLNQNDQRQSLANMIYSARPPVFIPTNGPNSNDFRFYLDLNRNGRFEENGLALQFDGRGVPIRDGNGRQSRSFMIGDPEWIGVLQYPDRPHSATNRFVGRYAFIALPAGKTLDINFMHNRAKFTTERILANEGFHRNQGFGSWELNLAALLRDLNTNSWDYSYASGNLSSPSTGFGFSDANALLAYRYSNSLSSLKSVSALFGANGAAAFQGDRIDGYSRAPQGDPPVVASDPDNPGLRWAGSDNPEEFFDLIHLYDTNRVPTAFTNRLRAPSFRGGTYDRYTYYRMLAQVGFDSVPANRGRMHLNYNNSRFAATNFVTWEPVEFFTNAAQRMLTASIETYSNRFGTNYTVGEFLVRSNLSITNIQVFPFSEYSASVHRILQLAANIYDASTNRVDRNFGYPSVFRPVFSSIGSNVFITGYKEVVSSADLNLPWIDVRIPAQRASIGVSRDVNVYGIPWVIAARKGLPNFNEYQLQSVVQVTRKLEFRKKSATDRGPFDVYQMYIVGVSNSFGVEYWNSYSNVYSRPTTLLMTNSVSGVLWDRRANRALGRLDRTISRSLSKTWGAGELFVPFATNIVFIPDSAYFSLPSGDLRPLSARPTFDPNPSHPTPEWDLVFTNRLVMAAVDQGTGRVIDFVNLDQLPSGFNVTTNLVDARNAQSDRLIADSSFWLTNRAGSTALPAGHTNQVYVSANDVLSDSDWASYSLNPISGGDKRKAIDGFRLFLGLQPLYFTGRSQPSTNLVVQVPFSPSRKFVQTLSWQANDPLVHYHFLDLYDPSYSNPNLVQPIKPPLTIESQSNLGKLNPRYQPWGGASNKTEVAFDYDLGFKDPLVRQSDDWNFPSGRFPTIGWLGRVHRGTPWQTVYLKASAADTNSWMKWSGSLGNHPTNDWKLLGLFTTAPNDNAARGLLSVNQTNLAAWSAVLSGVNLSSNSVPNADINRFARANYAGVVAEPTTPQLHSIVAGIMRTRTNLIGQTFTNLGSILAVPELTVRSPFLNVTNQNQLRHGIDDAAYERIPQQILSLLKEDEPRMVIYSFGQSLRPAGPPYSAPSIVAGGAFSGLCTNYQVTGEVVTKTVLRVEGAATAPKIVVESHNVLPAE